MGRCAAHYVKQNREAVMRNVLVTGSAGLVGSEAVRFYNTRAANVVGIDNNMRATFFGATAIQLAAGRARGDVSSLHARRRGHSRL